MTKQRTQADDSDTDSELVKLDLLAVLAGSGPTVAADQVHCPSFALDPSSVTLESDLVSSSSGPLLSVIVDGSPQLTSFVPPAWLLVL